MHDRQHAGYHDMLCPMVTKRHVLFKERYKICLDEREKQKSGEEARCIAADKAAREARRPRSKANIQRGKRKKILNIWER